MTKGQDYDLERRNGNGVLFGERMRQKNLKKGHKVMIPPKKNPLEHYD
ncbi:hypothetical protein [Holospora undulata]|nr:hypothetical protein [Holospora undulata]